MDGELLLLVIGLAFHTAYGYPDWDELKVRFGGFACDDTTGFYDLPKTESEAKISGYQQVSDCERGQGWRKWAGKRYRRVSGSDEVIVIYDVNGNVAGVQSGIPDGPGFQTSKLRNQPLVRHRGKNFLTFYFIDPETICTTGRGQSNPDSIGTGLYIQNGSRYTDSVEVPLDEAMLASTDWNRGVCLPIMGRHYRHGFTKDSPCDGLEPPFLMYNNGQLDGFGWTIAANISSSIFEYPPVLPSKNTPRCLLNYHGGMTGLHFYLSDPCSRTCPPGESYLETVARQ